MDVPSPLGLVEPTNRTVCHRPVTERPLQNGLLQNGPVQNGPVQNGPVQNWMAGRCRRGRLIPAAFAVVVTLSATFGRAAGPVVEPQHPEGGREPKMNTEYVTYLKPIGPSATISILAVEGDETELILTGPADGIDGFDRSEIGVYLRELESGEYDVLRELAKEAIDAAEAATVPPGTPLVTVGIGDEADDSLQAVSFPLSSELPEIARRLDRKMAAVASFLARFPDQTLLGSATWDRPESRADEIRVTLTLKSSGTKTVRVNHPAAAPEDSDVGLTVVLERDLPDEQLEDEDRGFLSISRDGVRLIEAPGWEPGEPAPDVVPLKPGESVTLSLTVTNQVFLDPGGYRGTIRFENRLGELQEDQGVEGLLQIPLGKIAILPNQSE